MQYKKAQPWHFECIQELCGYAKINKGEHMELSQSILKGKWTEIKGEVQKAWGKLTHDELEQTKGDLTAIQGLIEQKYGQKKEDYKQQLNGIISRFSEESKKTAESVKKSLKS